MGSLGDAWDGLKALPPEPGFGAPTAPTSSKNAAAINRVSLEDVKHLKPVVGLHYGVIGAWILAMMALTSTGPAARLRLPLALAGLAAAGTAIILLRTKHREQKGIAHAVTAVVLILAIIAFEVLARLGVETGLPFP